MIKDLLTKDVINNAIPTAKKYTKSIQDVDDVISQSYEKALKTQGPINPLKINSWFKAIVRNTAKNLYRYEKPLINISLLRDILETPTKPDLREEINWLYDNILSLPRKQRQIVEYFGLRGFSMREAAEIAGMSVVQAKGNYRHGLLKLKEIYKKRGIQ